MIGEFISKFGHLFPINVVRGTAISFDAAPDDEWFPEDVREGFNFKTSKWEDLEVAHIPDGETNLPNGTLERTGLFIRFRPPGEKWLYYPIEILVVQTIEGATVPDEAVEAAEFYGNL